jgi:LuxR family maltose regulon positive regulatory protein
MPSPVLATKLYIPPPRAKIVLRPRLIEHLDAGLTAGSRLTLISASAGFGKTTLVSEWIAVCERPAAWLSLDEGDNDPTRFLTYLVAVLQTIAPDIGKGALAALQSPQPPSTEAILTALLNEITTVPDHFILVLDDYHVLDSKPVDEALTFLLEHLPPQMHLVIATREDPHLPLARLRARGQLTELRAADLRFTPAEAAEFLNQVMTLNLSEEDIAALESRTEGWIVGLQLAALSMHRHSDAASFIQSFTGSHHFVLDYLIEEVLGQQSESIQTFLLRTSILNRMCGSLCDAVLLDKSASGQETAGQETLEYLERANLFIVPLDNERRWYRYHHLFAELLRQRLQQCGNVAEYHIRASQWYEDNGFELEAFQHAATAKDVERASRLIQGKGMPLHVRGALIPVLNWLESLPTTALDERPMLWVMYAGALTTAGQTTGVEQKLKAAEAALQGAELDIDTRDILGRIANNRATLAFMYYQADTAIVQARRALEYLRPDNLPVRNISTWALGAAYQQKGDRTAASRALTEAISISQTIGHTFVTKLATMGLGRVQETENRLYLAAETYRHALELFGEYPLPSACEAHLGLARIYYEWNDLYAAEQHGQQSLRLAQQWDRVIDRFIVCEVFLARLKLARGDAAGAAAILTETEQSVRRHNFVHRIPDVAAQQVIVLLHQSDLDAAAHLAQTNKLPFSQARVYLAQGDAPKAMAVLGPLRQQMEAEGWADELLKVMVLQAVAHDAHGEKDKAAQVLGEALALAEPGGFVRIFVDEGEVMRSLIENLSRNRDHPLSGYMDKLLAAFAQLAAPNKAASKSANIHQNSGLIEPEVGPAKNMLIEPLSEREFEVLMLLRSELSGPEIAQHLIVSLNTLRTHTKNIFNKLGVNNRRAAVRRAEELKLF